MKGKRVICHPDDVAWAELHAQRLGLPLQASEYVQRGVACVLDPAAIERTGWEVIPEEEVLRP